MPENWLPVPGYEGLYEVSDVGRVRSVDRTIIRSNGRPCARRGVLLRANPGQSRHLLVRLMRAGSGETFAVHQLVARAFLGPAPQGMEILHWDDDKSNNTVGNLRYGTRSENMHDRVRNGLHFQANQTHCVNGHEFTPENTYARHRPGGGRICKTCITNRDRTRRQTA